MAIRVTQKDFLFRAIVLAVLIVLVVAFGSNRPPPATRQARAGQHRGIVEGTLRDPTALWTFALAFLTSVLACVGVWQGYFIRRADQNRPPLCEGRYESR